MSVTHRTAKGRSFVLFGEVSLITPDRLSRLEKRFDSDPRIASVSVVAHPTSQQEFLRAVAPAGCAVAVSTDVEDLTGPVPASPDQGALALWARTASERGLWHDWWLTSARDVARSENFIDSHHLDSQEASDLASSRAFALETEVLNRQAITLTIDATWLGPHQTGAQVLTTAAIEALASNGHVSDLRLVGLSELPAYADRLAEATAVRLVTVDDALAEGPSDVIWYPNQIDQRVDINLARSLGRRVVTTYLDLIAYDIPRYHASDEAWAAYRGLQRRMALSVDGISTISVDVANRVLQEVPRLVAERVQPIPLGLDHITTAQNVPDSDIESLRDQLGSRPFVLVFGNDFQHKNRDFAIKVWEKTLEAGVNCDLVLAGLHVKSSSSRELEDQLLSQHTNLRGQAHSVGHVSPGSREWLLEHAAVVLYPSSAEGFGFVPYEAAALGTPSTFAAFGPLAEISGVKDVPPRWSVDAFAADVQVMLTDPDRAHERVSSLRTAIESSTWTQFAEQLLGFIERIDALPPVEGSLVGGGTGDAAALSAVLSSKTWRATSPLRKLGKRMRG